MSSETIFVAGPTGNPGWPPIEAGLESGQNIIAQGWRLERPAGFEKYPNFSARQAGVTREDEIRGVCRGVEVVIKMRYITT